MEVAAGSEAVQHHMLKVTGLGQLARLIELGCNVVLRSLGSASQHCPRPVAAGLINLPVQHWLLSLARPGADRSWP